MKTILTAIALLLTTSLFAVPVATHGVASKSASLIETIDEEPVREEGDTDLVPGIRREDDRVLALGRSLSVWPPLLIFIASVSFIVIMAVRRAFRSRRFRKEDEAEEREKEIARLKKQKKGASGPF